MVSTTHIDAMLTAGLAYAIPGGPLYWYWAEPHAVNPAAKQRYALTPQTAGTVGALLLAENRRSVDHRYREEEWEEPYLFTRLPGWPDPAVVLKAVHCYEYQSCEHPGWETSQAYAFIRRLERAAIYRVPGYEDAPWEIGSREVFRSS
jgi:hypothetical protein